VLPHFEIRINSCVMRELSACGQCRPLCMSNELIVRTRPKLGTYY
jgi:hypothetical protein